MQTVSMKNKYFTFIYIKFEKVWFGYVHFLTTNKQVGQLSSIFFRQRIIRTKLYQ